MNLHIDLYIPSEECESEYEWAANQWLELTDSQLYIRSYRHGAMPHWGDRRERDLYVVELVNRHGQGYLFDFGQSIADQGNQPTAYDILAGIDAGYADSSLDEIADDYCLMSLASLESAYAIAAEIKHRSARLAAMYTPDELQALSDIC